MHYLLAHEQAAGGYSVDMNRIPVAGEFGEATQIVGREYMASEGFAHASSRILGRSWSPSARLMIQGAVPRVFMAQSIRPLLATKGS